MGNVNIIPFGATMSTPTLGDCPASVNGSPTAWAYPDWGQCWSATVTAVRSDGYLDSANAYSAQVSLKDFSDGTDADFKYYSTGVSSSGDPITWSIYWREQDLPGAG